MKKVFQAQRVLSGTITSLQNFYIKSLLAYLKDFWALSEASTWNYLVLLVIINETNFFVPIFWSMGANLSSKVTLWMENGNFGPGWKRTPKNQTNCRAFLCRVSVWEAEAGWWLVPAFALLVSVFWILAIRPYMEQLLFSVEQRSLRQRNRLTSKQAKFYHESSNSKSTSTSKSIWQPEKIVFHRGTRLLELVRKLSQSLNVFLYLSNTIKNSKVQFS